MKIEASKLKVGQRFSWIPKAWHGPCRLTSKIASGDFLKITFDTKIPIVNPPAIAYVTPNFLFRKLRRANGHD